MRLFQLFPSVTLLISGLIVHSLHVGCFEALAESDAHFIETIENPGSTYLTQRVWLNNENKSFFEDQSRNVIAYNFEGETFAINMVEFVNANNRKALYFADIPYRVNNVHFLRMNDSGIQNDVSVELSYGVCYFVDTTDYNIITPGIVFGSDGSLLSLVVEAYLSFGDSASNGVATQTVSNLFYTWFLNKKASDEELLNVSFLDYSGYSANGNKYDGLVKDKYYSVDRKWKTMCSRAGIDPHSGMIRTKDMAFTINDSAKTLIYIGSFLVSAGGGAALFLLIKRQRKKKAD